MENDLKEDIRLTDAWNALHWDLPHALFEARETWVNLPDLTLFPLN